MTAEITVMNQHAVALAADSAATVAGTKIFAADKIFALSKYEPVGIMVYGAASTMNVPWHTIIKLYRAQLGTQKFDSLRGYVDDFLAFMASDRVLFPDEQREFFAYSSARQRFAELRKGAVAEVDRVARANGGITDREARKVVLTRIRDTQRGMSSMTRHPGIRQPTIKKLRATYAPQIDAAADDIFEALSLTKTARAQLHDIAIACWTKADLAGDSGLVFAGFGHRDVFPSVISVEVDGVLLDQPIYWDQTSPPSAITHYNRANVRGFAQHDVIGMFMEGVTPAYQKFVEEFFQKVISTLASTLSTPQNAALAQARDDLLATFATELANHRHEQYVDPVLNVVASLPKDELASLAESLVNLTSLKRRISWDHETVGGEIDVAVISKGDGFVWIRRKHYFEPHLNHQFFSNYNRSQHVAQP